MANTQAIRRRIRSVKSTKQITKAMELVAASKMRRAQEATLKTRLYRNSAREILQRISHLIDVSTHPLYQKRELKKKLIIVVSSDRGLAGAYNSNVLKAFVTNCKQSADDGATVEVVAVGRQVARLASRLEGIELIAAYEGFPEKPSEADLLPILNLAIEKFTKEEADQVEVIYTDYVSSITQEVTTEVLLPAVVIESEAREDLNESVFEPSPKAVLEAITPRVVAVQLLQALLESFASEHSMRMMAMKNASDNAGDIIEDLTLAFNGARQAAITQELAEITGGAEAIA